MEAPLRPATPDEVAEALSFALRYAGRRRVPHAESMRLRLTAERLAAHLEEAGFVVMKRREAELIAATRGGPRAGPSRGRSGREQRCVRQPYQRLG